MRQKISAKLRGLKREKTDSPPESSRVTDETLEQHRKEIFARGRRFVYPIHLTKHNIVRKSILVMAILFVVFLGSVGLAIYRYHTSSTFIYRVSKVLPFPVARVGSDFVSYGEYLFLLRSNQTYITTKQTNDPDTQSTLQQLRQDSLAQAKQNAMTKQLARHHGVVVSNKEVDTQIELLQSFSGGENRLDEIVSDYYDISTEELRYLLYIQLLRQHLAPLLSSEARVIAEGARERVSQGEDFTALASELSADELTASKGGVIGVVGRDNQDVPAVVIEAGLALPVGGLSEVVVGPSGFHIVKKLSDKDSSMAELAHIMVRYDDLDAIIAHELEKTKIRNFIRL